MIELQMLNAVLANRDPSVLVRNGLMDKSMWATHPDAFKFIEKHLEQYGELPSINNVIMAVDNFEMTEVTESCETLAKKMVERNIKNSERQFLQDIAKKWGELDAYDVMDEMSAKLEQLRSLSNHRGNNGIDWATSGEERRHEYEQRKKKGTSNRLPFMFDELTTELGPILPGMYLAVMAFTSRGKTWIALKEALRCNTTGKSVLMESGEMSKPEILFRLDTLATGFSNRGLFTGDLDFRSEEQYFKWLDEFNNGTGKTPLIIKSQEDWLYGLTLQQIEADIQTHKPDLLIIDQFSLIRHSSPDRAGMTNTSRRLKELAGKYGIAILLLYQANGEYEKSKSKSKAGTSDDNSLMVLEPPTLTSYSETIAVPQDVDVLLTFESCSWYDEATKKRLGRALMFVAKSRSGGEGTELDIDWRPNEGVINTRTAIDVF